MESYVTWLLLAITVVISVLAGVFSWQLHTLRKTLDQRFESKEGVLLLPESFMSTLEGRSEIVHQSSLNLMNLVAKTNKQLEGHSANISESITAIKDTLEIYASQTLEKERELTRLKSGYDAYLLSKFSERIAKVHTILEKELEASETEKETELFSDVIEAIESALEGTGIDKFYPEVGADVNDSFGINSNIKTIETDQEQLHGKIAEVLQPGLKISSTEESLPPIKKARVSVYKFESKAEEA